MDLNQTQSNVNQNCNTDDVRIPEDDVKEEIHFWESSIVCNVLGVKPLYRII